MLREGGKKGEIGANKKRIKMGGGEWSKLRKGLSVVF